MAEINLTVDARVFRMSAVKKAAYRLGDRCSARIELGPDDAIHVCLTPRSDRASNQSLEGDFRNELLDQDLRESIAEQTERVRNLILAQAFSGVPVTGAEAETADYHQDPLGIGRLPDGPRNAGRVNDSTEVGDA